MPKVNPKALLELDEVRHAFEVAKATGPLPGALFAWTYEFGARAAEPGLQKLTDVDLEGGRARIVHLKTSGPVRGTDWDALLPYCRAALPRWLKARPEAIQAPGQKPYLFPSRVPGRCPTCRGTGERHAQRDGAVMMVRCHHCAGAGKRWGVSRFEVYEIITDVLSRAGVREGCRHPHTLRHSIITHLLEGNVPAAVIQERVGHRFLQTTLGYVRATKTARAKLEGALSGLYDEKG